MSGVRTILVCLPRRTPTERWPELAAELLADHGLTVRGTVAHFRVGTRRTRRLLHRRGHTAAGGPLRLLDLAGMRRHAHARAGFCWQVWSDVVAGTRPARPYWVFLDRHIADPARYPLRLAWAQFTSQPRLQAMAAYNSLPFRSCDLPADDIEAFQAGPVAYTSLGWLAAVPGDGLSTTDGEHTWLLSGGRRDLNS